MSYFEAVVAEVHFKSRSIVVSDGFVTSGCYAIEPKTHAVMTEYFGARPVCYFGPLAPPPQEEELNHKELAQTTRSDDVKVFMERALKEKGRKSLLYVRSEAVYPVARARLMHSVDLVWLFLFNAGWL